MISNSVMVSMIVTIVLAAAGIIVPFVMIYITARKKETGSFASFGLGILASVSYTHLTLPTNSRV